MSDMREGFEKWAAGFTFYIDLSRGNHGVYVNVTTHMLYCSWVQGWNSGRCTLIEEQAKGALS